MIKFDHMSLPVSNSRTSRDWYAGNFGFKVEFEVPDRQTVALQELKDKRVAFDKARGKYLWGYGAELLDPDGYRVMLWDEVSMREKGESA